MFINGMTTSQNKNVGSFAGVGAFRQSKWLCEKSAELAGEFNIERDTCSLRLPRFLSLLKAEKCEENGR